MGWKNTVTVIESPLCENRIQAEANYLSDRNCGLIDNRDVPWVVYDQGFIPPDCAPFGLPKMFYGFLSLIASFWKLLWVSSAALLFIDALILWQRKRRESAEIFGILLLPIVIT